MRFFVRKILLSFFISAGWKSAILSSLSFLFNSNFSISNLAPSFIFFQSSLPTINHVSVFFSSHIFLLFGKKNWGRFSLVIVMQQRVLSVPRISKNMQTRTKSYHWERKIERAQKEKRKSQKAGDLSYNRLTFQSFNSVNECIVFDKKELISRKRMKILWMCMRVCVCVCESNF